VFTIVEHQGKLKGLKVAFFGDGNNVARSLMYACALGGAHFVCASPRGYALDDASVDVARGMGGEVTRTEDPQAAAREADVLYTDVWASMGQEEQAAQRASIFPPYQLNAALVALSKPKSIVMHCLPAHRGAEITDEVADGAHSVLFDQAENRMHAQKAILAILMADQKRRPAKRKK
jgi:ornithine carbamoyltransferase